MTDRVLLAKAEAEDARRRLAATIKALQAGIPRRLVSKAWTEMREKSEAAADEALRAVRERPAAAGGAVAALLLVLARRPVGQFLAGAFSRRRGRYKKQDRARRVAKRSQDEGTAA